MSCNMKIDTLTTDGASEEPDIHLMPCKIDYDGEANVREYFYPVVTSKGADCCDVFTSSFRGRPLEGHKLPVPEGYVGLVLKELPVEASLNGDNDDDGKRLAVTHKFKDFTYWNLDLTPSVDDKIVQAMKWIDIANVIHGSTAPNGSSSSSSLDSERPSQ